MNHPDPEGRIADLRLRLRGLIREAERMGCVITVDLVRTTTLVMGQQYMVADVRPNLVEIRRMLDAGWYDPDWAPNKMRVRVDGKIEWRTFYMESARPEHGMRMHEGLREVPDHSDTERVEWVFGDDIPLIIKI